jgi:predicted DCC family thiol-disulfide oxidoreductase YuxK
MTRSAWTPLVAEAGSKDALVEAYLCRRDQRWLDWLGRAPVPIGSLPGSTPCTSGSPRRTSTAAPSSTSPASGRCWPRWRPTPAPVTRGGGAGLVGLTTGGEKASPIRHRVPRGLRYVGGVGDGPIVLFDGKCNLCAGVVTWVLDHEADHEIRFASLQSPHAAALLGSVGMEVPVADPDTIVVIEGGRGYLGADATMRIARHFRQPYRSIAEVGLAVLPKAVRDGLYDEVARNRYRWFGQRDQCWIPGPEVESRFVGQ